MVETVYHNTMEMSPPSAADEQDLAPLRLHARSRKRPIRRWRNPETKR